MIIIFDLFETIIDNVTIDFNAGLLPLWEKYYRDKCTFDEIKAYGEELFEYMMELHGMGREFPFVKDELPLYAKKFGGIAPKCRQPRAGNMIALLMDKRFKQSLKK